MSIFTMDVQIILSSIYYVPGGSFMLVIQIIALISMDFCSTTLSLSTCGFKLLFNLYSTNESLKKTKPFNNVSLVPSYFMCLGCSVWAEDECRTFTGSLLDLACITLAFRTALILGGIDSSRCWRFWST